MNNRQHCYEQLHQVLRAEYDCAGQLKSVLTAEAEALASRDVDALDSLISNKHELMHSLEALEVSKQQLLEQAGFGNSSQNIQACLDWCDERGQLHRGWQLLLERLGQCQHLNRINGATLESSRRHVQQALSILRGEAAPVSLYNPAGTSTPGIEGSRSLAKA